MRLPIVAAASLALLHVARPADVILLPDPAQELWPVPELVVPEADFALVEGSVMEEWESRPTVVTAEEVRTDRFLWRAMFFRNWDRLPSPLREEGLAAMHARYRPILRGPERWASMDAEDWDRVPQPMRAMAVLGMIDCWQRHYRPGAAFGLDERAIGDRIKAVAMSESWFLHRAVSENTDGSRDLGIAQASAPTRSRIRVLYVRGVSDFGLADDEYFDPWKATRALVYWFSLLLEETAGDADMATRAYNVGGESARAGGGDGYLEGVLRREREYLRGRGPSASWRWLRVRSPSPCPGDASAPSQSRLMQRATPPSRTSASALAGADRALLSPLRVAQHVVVRPPSVPVLHGAGLAMPPQQVEIDLVHDGSLDVCGAFRRDHVAAEQASPVKSSR
jgi:hypothetical protein